MATGRIVYNHSSGWSASPAADGINELAIAFEPEE
ncbi:MAG: hypothetical protein ACI9G1_004108 [Pirellulaceae bacterium]|jgi:hypothetical protein